MRKSQGRLNFMKFYPADFFMDGAVRRLRDVPGCSNAYLALLVLLWMDGGKSFDVDADIAQQLQIEVDTWKLYRSVLLGRDLIDEDVDEFGEAVLTQRRILRDLELAEKRAAERDENFAKGRAKANANKQRKSKASKPRQAPVAGDQQPPVSETSDRFSRAPARPPSRSEAEAEAEAEEGTDVPSTAPSSDSSVEVERYSAASKPKEEQKQRVGLSLSDIARS